MNLLKKSCAILLLSASSLSMAENVVPPTTPGPNGSRYDNEAQQREDNCGLATMWFTYNRFFDSACPWSRDRNAIADSLRDTFKRRCSNTSIRYWGMQNRLSLTNRLEDEASDAHMSTADYCQQINTSFVRLGKTADHNLKFGVSQKSDISAAENVLKVPEKPIKPVPKTNTPAPDSYN